MMRENEREMSERRREIKGDRNTHPHTHRRQSAGVSSKKFCSLLLNCLQAFLLLTAPPLGPFLPL